MILFRFFFTERELAYFKKNGFLDEEDAYELDQ